MSKFEPLARIERVVITADFKKEFRFKLSGKTGFPIETFGDDKQFARASFVLPFHPVIPDPAIPAISVAPVLNFSPHISLTPIALFSSFHPIV
jgi:hypothetical protein